MLFEYSLITYTSVVTFSVAGIFKEILTIFVGGAVFGDRFGFWNTIGLIISLCGIIAYNYVRLFLSPHSSLGGHGHSHPNNNNNNNGDNGGSTVGDGGIFQRDLEYIQVEDNDDDDNNDNIVMTEF